MAFIISESSREPRIHRHRILTGDSIGEKGKFNFLIAENSDFLFGKYWFTISRSDKNQNLIHTKL